jgi:8-oxo-dGTP pyrophosphatase MutT (NUDIX family)
VVDRSNTPIKFMPDNQIQSRMNSVGVVSVSHADRLNFAYAPWSWPFAGMRRQEIDAFFSREREENPFLWNGRLLLLRNAQFAGETLSGTFFETDYASLLAALAWDAMGPTVTACFPAAAIFGSDGGLILGEMAAQTRNAGQLLFPSGSVERADVVGDQVNFGGALRREVMEETGIASEMLKTEDGWYVVRAGSRLPLIKIAHLHEVAEKVRQRIIANLSAQPEPEFRRIIIVWDRSGIADSMPPWVRGFLEHIWS